MKLLFNLTRKSLFHRKVTATLTLMSIIMSVVLLLGVDRLRKDAKQSFQNTISNIDLIIGAKTGPSQLLLSTVFHQGFPSNNISFDFFKSLKQRPDVNFAIPISLGDSHKGYRVIGTSTSFFEHFYYGNKQPLAFETGQQFSKASHVVLGWSVAQTMGYQINDPIVVSHGIGETSFDHHDEHPFTVKGILKRTGTPVDRALYVSLQGIEKIHLDPKADMLKIESAEPISITAAFVGLQNKVMIFNMQREINHSRKEALMAIIPGQTFYEIWQIVSIAEKALKLISFFVLIATLIGLLVMMLSNLEQRRREISILRAQGASALQVGLLFIFESTLLMLLGIVLGCLALAGFVLLFQNTLQVHFGIYLTLPWADPHTLKTLSLMLIAGLLTGLVPAIAVYRRSLNQGLNAI